MLGSVAGETVAVEVVTDAGSDRADERQAACSCAIKSVVTAVAVITIGFLSVRETAKRCVSRFWSLMGYRKQLFPQ